MSSMRTYDIGDRPRITARFTNLDGVPETPTSIVVKVKHPSGTEVSYSSPHASITSPVAGAVVFEFPSVLDVDGTWHVRVIGAAGVNAAAETPFSVRPSAFTAP